MATLQKLRNKAGLLLAIVIFIALAAFILGDLVKSGDSVMRGKQMEIASINGDVIKYPDFQASFDEMANVYKNNYQVNSLDEKAYQQILNQTWETMLQDKIMGKIYGDLGIDVTSNEMFDMVQGNNLHPIIVQIFGDPQTRQVNKANVIRFLKYIEENPESPQRESWMSIEKQIISSKKLSKYTDLVAKGLTVNTLQAKQSLAEKNITASLKFIQKKYLSIPDSSVVVSDSELKKYYQDHIDEFQQKNQRNISYVVFKIVPSADDDRDALKYVEDLKNDFASATDNAQFVNSNSDTRFDESYLSEKEMTPTLSNWAFNAKINDVYGPVKEGNFYKVYKLNETKMLPDSVKTSHILIRAQNSNELQEAMVKIDSIKNLIEAGKITFELAARTNSADGSASKGGDLGWVKKGMMVPSFERAAFLADKDELVTAQTRFGAHLIKVTAQGPKSKNVQLAVLDREVTASTTTYQNIYSEASKFAAKAQDFDGLNKIAAEDKISVQSAMLGENDRSVAGLGAVRSLVRAAFLNGKKGELLLGQDHSPIFETEDKFIVAAVRAVLEEGDKPFESVKPSIELAVDKEKKQKILTDKFNAARGANIEQTASKLNVQVDSASGFRLAYGSVNAIGYEPAVNGAVEKLKVNQQSKPIVGRNGVYIVELTEKTGLTDGDINAEKHSLFLNSSYKANYQAYETLKKSAKIVDKRWKFY